MISFFNWFFLRAPRGQFYAIVHILIFFEDFLGFSVNIKYFFSPIFNDTTIFGRIMSLIIRSVLVLSGLIALSIIGIILLILPSAWFLSLILWIYNPVFLLIPLLGTVYYLVFTRNEASQIYISSSSQRDLSKFMPAVSKRLLLPPYDQLYFNNLLQSQSVDHFLQRLLMTSGQFNQLFSATKAYTEFEITEMVTKMAHELNIRIIRPVHIFAAHLIINEPQTSHLLQSFKLDSGLMKKYLAWEEYEYNLYNPPHLWEKDYRVHINGGSNVTWQGTVTPILNQFSRDLTMMAGTRELKVLRKPLIQEIEEGLQKSMSASVLLVGEIGVGKDALIEIIAQQINKGEIKGFLWSKRIVQLNIGQLYAGTTEKGVFEKRVEDIINEINRSGNIVLYLNDLKSAMQISVAGTISLFSLLQDSLSKNKLHLIASVTPKQLTTISNENPQFIHEFTTINVDEPDESDTTNILFNQALIYEQEKLLFFPYPVIEHIYKYAKDYIITDHFPQKGLFLLESSAIKVVQQRTSTAWKTIYGTRIPVLEEAVNQTISQTLHIAVGDTTNEESQKLLHLEENFSKKIVGQTDAVTALAKVLRRNRVGLRNKNKPVGSFLFVGPTGVGKTKTAKVIAEEYFGDENRMIRFDMSEFQTLESIERLIGSEKRGSNYLTLTEQLKKQPFSLVLLDELEKAHPQILDLFLQILDDARITDAQGETIRCHEAIFIATSNAGTKTITDMFTHSTDPNSYSLINKQIYDILSNYFRIEFLNRFDEIIIFKPLTPISLKQIVNLELKSIAQTLFEQQKITLSFTDAIVKEIIERGYNPELGARPLERAIQEIVESRLAILMLEKKIRAGAQITL